MADRSSAPAKKTQNPGQDVSTLQKRGRRRLVGAIALVLLAVIVLPMVFDPEPRTDAPLVNVRIPSEEGGKFTPKAAAGSGVTMGSAPESKPAESPTAQSPPQGQPAVRPEPEKPQPDKAAVAQPAPIAKPVELPKPVKPAEKPAAKVPEKSAATPSSGEQFMVQVGAFASAEKIREIGDKLKDAKLPFYTESVAVEGGSVTRVRVGPFGSKDAAEKARARTQALGLSPANVAPK